MSNITLYIHPHNDAANNALVELVPDISFVSETCYDHRGHLEGPLPMAKVSARVLDRLHADAAAKGLVFTAYSQKEGRSIFWLDVSKFLGEWRQKNRTRDSRLLDPFKQGRRSRRRVGLPPSVVRGTMLKAS